MTETPTPPRRTLRCRTLAAGGFEQMNYVRGLPPLAVAERFGPLEEAPVTKPSETLLAAFGSCLSTHIYANAASGNITVQSLMLDVKADVLPSPLWGPRRPDPGPVGFDTIRVTMTIQSDAPREAIRALVAHAVLWSPVANTLHGPVHLDVTVAEPAAVLS